MHFLPADIRHSREISSFLGWCSKEQQHRVEHITEMDVEFNRLSNDVMSIFDGWEPAALFNAKHEKTVPNDVIQSLQKK